MGTITMNALATSSLPTSDVISLVNNVAALNLGYLGICVTILALLGGATYIFNIKPFKEALEKQEGTLLSLKEEVEANLSSSKAEIKSDLSDFEKRQTNTVKSVLEQDNEKLTSDIQARIANFERDLIQKIDTVSGEKDTSLKVVLLAEVGNQIRDLEKALTSVISINKANSEKESSTLKSEIASLKEDLKDTKRRTKELEVYKFSKEGRMGAIYGAIELLKEAIDEDSWRIESYLETLNKEIDGINLETNVVTKIEEQLTRLSTKLKYAPLFEKIRKNYQSN